MIFLLAACADPPPPPVPEPVVEPAPTDVLVDAEGVTLVRAHCTGCHSAKLVVQNRHDREGWTRIIRWMQAKQGLWPIPPDQEDVVLTYLSEHYAPEQRGSRRPPLPPELLPPDP